LYEYDEGSRWALGLRRAENRGKAGARVKDEVGALEAYMAHCEAEDRVMAPDIDDILARARRRGAAQSEEEEEEEEEEDDDDDDSEESEREEESEWETDSQGAEEDDQGGLQQVSEGNDQGISRCRSVLGSQG
jgi:hypothetical protein